MADINNWGDTWGHVLVNPLWESLNATLTTLAKGVLLPYLFLAPVETTGSFQACPNNRSSWGFLCGSACRAGLFPRCEITYAQTCCQTHKGGEADGEHREGWRIQEQIYIKVLSGTGPFQNGHCTGLFPLGKLAYNWWFLNQYLCQQLNISSLGSNLGKMVSCLPLKKLASNQHVW